MRRRQTDLIRKTPVLTQTLPGIEQQGILSVHRVRQGFVKARAAQAYQIRGLLGEFGPVIPKGICHVARCVPARDTEVPAKTAAALQGSSPATALLDAAGMARFEAELARFIGPVARHLVNRAAVRSSGVEELLALLGREIESETERRAVITAARQSWRARS